MRIHLGCIKKELKKMYKKLVFFEKDDGHKSS